MLQKFQSSRRQRVLASVILSVVYFVTAVGVWSLQQRKFDSIADNVVPPTSYIVSPTTGPAQLTVSVEYPNFGDVKGGRSIDWGDGSPATTIIGATGRISHIYTAPGSYVVNLYQCIEVCRRDAKPTLLATVTVVNQSIIPPTATLTGPTSVTKGNKVVYAPIGTAGSGTLTSLKVYRSPKQTPNSWVELSPLVCAGITCQSLSWDTTNEAVGDYYVVANAANSFGGQCSGNATGGTKDLWGNALTGWSDCGSGSRLTVSLVTTTVATTTPTPSSTQTSTPMTSTTDRTTSQSPGSSTAIASGTTLPPLASPPTTSTTIAQAETTTRGAAPQQSFQLVATGGSLLFNLAIALLLSLLTTLFFLHHYRGDVTSVEETK